MPKKKKTKKIIKAKPKTETKFTEKQKKYWEYYSIIIFLVFCVLFISILIIATFAVFGKNGIWLVIPVTAILWGISYVIAKVVFKKK